MDKYIKISAKSVEDAILEASIQFGTTRENIDYRVIEHETKGFLGLGAKKAVIEARKKVSFDEDNIIKEVFSEKSDSTKKTAAKKKPAKKEKKPEKAERAEKTERTDKPVKEEKAGKEKDKKAAKAVKEEKAVKVDKPEKAEKAERPEKAAKAEKADRPEKTEKKEKAEKPEKAEKTERTPREPADPEVAKARADQFLTDVFAAMDLEVEKNITFENDVLSIELSGDEMGVLIGKRGQTLDSIQYLTSLIVNKGKAAYVRVKVDTENYRERRRATLENLAKNIAFKVKKTRRSVYLEPMNPYERRIIHSALQSDPYVTTHSEGEEPLRKVVVTLKKRERPEDMDEQLFDEE